MEVHSDHESKEKIRKQLIKKDYKRILKEIKELSEEPGDLGARRLKFKYIIDCYGEHIFDIDVYFRKEFPAAGKNEIKYIVVTCSGFDYNKEPMGTTTLHVHVDNNKSIPAAIYGSIVNMWDGKNDWAL